MKFWKYDIALDPTPVVIGFLQGLAIYAVSELLPNGPSPWKNTLHLFLILAPGFLMLATRPASRVRDLIAAGALGVFFAGLLALLQASIGISGTAALWGSFSLCATAAGYVLLCFYQPARDSGFRAIPYPKLYEAAWNNLLILVLSACFTAVVWLVLYLWGQLFHLIALDIFKTLFAKDWFGWPFYGAIFGLGIALLRQLDAPIQTARRPILAAYRVLAVIVAFACILFLLALPFTGLAPLWATRQATLILLSMVIAFVIFVNGAIQDGREPNPFWQPVTLLIKGFMIALPIYGLLAFYAVWLRVAQYGLTPDRIAALVLASLAILYGLAYGAALLVKTRTWIEALTLVNPPLALITVAVFVLMHIPGIDPVNLSVRHQLNRLQSGKVEISAFDFGALKFQYGKPGQRALDKIRADSKFMAEPDAKTAFAQLDAATNIHDWRLAEDKTRKGLTGQKREALLTTLDHLPLFPSNALMPERFLPALLEMAPDLARNCARETATGTSPCAMILLDFNRDGYDDTAIWNGGSGLSLFIWNAPKDHYEAPLVLSTTVPLSLDILRAADRTGAIRIVPARVDSLIIGDIRFD